MANTLKMDESLYSVVLTDDHSIFIAEARKNEAVFDHARRIIECEWIEIVEPDSMIGEDCVMLIDEEAKLKDTVFFVNCMASYLYGSHEHGDPIVGTAVIVKRNGDSLKMLTGEEALRLSQGLSRLQTKAFAAISPEFQLMPRHEAIDEARRKRSVVRELHQPIVKNRQPCKDDGKER